MEEKDLWKLSAAHAIDNKCCLRQEQGPCTSKGPAAVQRERKVDCTFQSYWKKNQSQKIPNQTSGDRNLESSEKKSRFVQW